MPWHQHAAQVTKKATHPPLGLAASLALAAEALEEPEVAEAEAPVVPEAAAEVPADAPVLAAEAPAEGPAALPAALGSMRCGALAPSGTHGAACAAAWKASNVLSPVSGALILS